jgi:RNA polymerase sigma factor (sigma-70 family)
METILSTRLRLESLGRLAADVSTDPMASPTTHPSECSPVPAPAGTSTGSTGSSGGDDTDVHDALAVGDRRRALTLLMRRYGDAVYRYCCDLIRDEAVAEDVHQQVFVEAYRDLPTFQHRSHLRTWLFGIARHRCLDAAKTGRRWQNRYKNETPGDLTDDTPPPADNIDQRRMVDALRHCLGELAPNSRSAVLLRFREGLSYEEMASMASEKPGTLQQRVARSMPVLRRCVERRVGDVP